jgi:ferredoxin-NADP reductase
LLCAIILTLAKSATLALLKQNGSILVIEYMEHIVGITGIRQVTHNVKAFKLAKPGGYVFVPGQATEVSINKPGWVDEKRPFTFTCLNSAAFLEFTIKIYSDHEGVTNQLDKLKEGDELIVRDVWGAISYHGPGYFIAGGAGITPFIAILRQLYLDKRAEGTELYFSNRTINDIILKDELDTMLGSHAHYILTGENNKAAGHIDKAFLQQHISDFTKPFYICGPDKMISDINQALIELGAKPDAVIFEK